MESFYFHTIRFDLKGTLAGILVVTAIGHIVAAPALFFCYFPASIWVWKNAKHKLLSLWIAGSIFILLNALPFVRDFEDAKKVMTLFFLCAWLTILLHYAVLTLREKMTEKGLFYMEVVLPIYVLFGAFFGLCKIFTN